MKTTSTKKKSASKTVETEIEQKLNEISEKNQKQLQKIFQNVPAPTAVFEGPEHKFILANKAYEKLFNRKEKDILGKCISEVFPELNGTGAIELVDRVFKTGESFSAPEYASSVNLNYGDDLQDYFNFYMEPLKNDSEEIYAVFAIMYPITEQVHARKKIEESEKQHAFLLKLSDALRLISGPQQIKIKAMQLLGEHLNVSRCYYAEVLKDGEYCVIDNSFSPGLGNIDGTYRLEDFGKAKVAMLQRGEVILTADVANDTLVTQAERERNLEMQILAYINVPLVKDNKFICLLGVNQSIVRNWTALDLTIVQETAQRTWAAIERAKAEEAMLNSEEKYRTLFTSIDQGFTLCELIRNKEGKGIDLYILEVNPTYEKQTGINKEMVIGKPLMQVFPSLDIWIDTYSAVVDNQRPVVFEHYFEDTERWFEIKAYPVEKERFAVLFSNITERKLYEKELLEAKTSAENAAKSRQQFLSTMSHEIRTPLNSIIGFTNVLFKTELGIEQKEFVQAIKTSGKSLNLLINDILDLAKVDAGKMTFEILPFEIQNSITSILHSFDMKIREKNLELIEEYDNKIPSILLGDTLRLNQIFLNLISNAVKFTHKGKIKLSVELLSESAENVTLKFVVTDSGIGIADNKLDSIFNLFEQADHSTSSSYGGTGLGLAIVKQLVEVQGGSINVKSKLGEGSVFSVIMPFGKTTIKLEPEIEILKPGSEIINLRVLVAEDVPLNQLLIKMILNDFGFEHEIVGNGKLAIEKIQTNTYDIILMDLQMPEMNGFEATEYIRKTLKSQIPIIALTADVTKIDISKCKEFGMDTYISKPIDETLLYRKIVELVKKE